MNPAQPAHLSARARPARVVPLPFVAADDAALVQGLLADNPGAKLAFFNRYAPDVERLVTHLIGLDRELPDILQEVFVQALASIRKLRDPAALRPWLMRIAAHSARRALRTRRRRSWLRMFTDAEEEARSEPVVEGIDAEGRETLRAVYVVLARMSADDRIAFALRYIDGMELTEVAAACSVSLATIKRRLRRSEGRFLKLSRSHSALGRWIKQGARWQER